MIFSIITPPPDNITCYINGAYTYTDTELIINLVPNGTVLYKYKIDDAIPLLQIIITPDRYYEIYTKM